MNIFRLSKKEIEKKMKEIFSQTSPEKVLQDLEKCGYKKEVQMTREDLNKNKQELKDYIYNKKWIEERLEDIKERKSLLDNITNKITDMPKGSNQIYDKQAENLIKIIDLTNDLEIYIKQLKEKQIIIEDKIDKIQQPYKNILYFRYIKGYNLTEVSNEINEEYDYTRKLHGKALEEYTKIGEINNGCYK